MRTRCGDRLRSRLTAANSMRGEDAFHRVRAYVRIFQTNPGVIPSCDRGSCCFNLNSSLVVHLHALHIKCTTYDVYAAGFLPRALATVDEA